MADKIKLHYAILLVEVGLLTGFVSVLPGLALDHEIIRLIFLPVLL